MSLILGAPLAAMGFETVALDDLGHGLTQVRPGFTQAYDDWVKLTAAFISHERATDSWPFVLYGLHAHLSGERAAHGRPRQDPAGSVPYPMSLASKMSARSQLERICSLLRMRSAGP